MIKIRPEVSGLTAKCPSRFLARSSVRFSIVLCERRLETPLLSRNAAKLSALSTIATAPLGELVAYDSSSLVLICFVLALSLSKRLDCNVSVRLNRCASVFSAELLVSAFQKNALALHSACVPLR